MIKAEKTDQVVVRLRDGEELLSSLAAVGVESAFILSGVGMLRDVELGYWNGTTYESEGISGPVELLSLGGNFARKDGELIVHAHAAVARRGGNAMGGHVIRATIQNTAEIFIRRLSGITLERKQEGNGLSGLYPRAS
jgi:uncharacterized protein